MHKGICCCTSENENEKETPLAYLLDIFAVLYHKEDWIAYVMCCPGDYTTSPKYYKN
jgi:hypothetical protein